MKMYGEISNLITHGKDIRHFASVPQYVSLLPATANRDKSALFH